MTQNVVATWPQIVGVVAGALVLIVFAIAVAIPHRPKVLPGSSLGAGEESGHEEIRPDGYVDTFSKEVGQARGGLPLIVKLALPGVLLWWLMYLILGLTQR
jgi:hypothetical protein